MHVDVSSTNVMDVYEGAAVYVRYPVVQVISKYTKWINTLDISTSVLERYCITIHDYS